MTSDLAPARASASTTPTSSSATARVRRRVELGGDRRLSARGARSAMRSWRASRRCWRRRSSRGKTRVVLIHHPPVRHKHGEKRNLRDRAALAAVLARAGAELVLHGHDHEDQRAELPGPGGGAIPIIGGGSASYTGGAERRVALQPVRDRGRRDHLDHPRPRRGDGRVQRSAPRTRSSDPPLEALSQGAR